MKAKLHLPPGSGRSTDYRLVNQASFRLSARGNDLARAKSAEGPAAGISVLTGHFRDCLLLYEVAMQSSYHGH